MMNILQFSDPSNGWIDITFGREPASYSLVASDVPNDCLADLAGATARLLAGSTTERVEFSLEPDFVVCDLLRDAATVRIILHEPKNSTPVFDAAFSLGVFARQLESEMLRIRPRYACDDGWTRPFPEREVASLA